jgi:hypothetical protein
MGIKLLSASGGELFSIMNPALYRIEDDSLHVHGRHTQRQLFPAAAPGLGFLSVYGRDGKMRRFQLGSIIDRCM